MAPIVATLLSTVSKIALNLIMKVLAEKFLEKFMRELILHALKVYTEKTETKVDDRLYELVKEAFEQPGDGK